MPYSVDNLIKLAIKKPVVRCYFKRRDLAGDYESAWQRIDSVDGINRIIDHGSITIKIDSSKIVINSYDIATYNFKAMNKDGYFNASNDYRSFFSGYLDHKDTRFKVAIALLDPDGVEVGTATAFEGLVDSINSGGNNIATVKCSAYSKKLKEYPFGFLDLVGNKTVTQILTEMFSDSRISKYFNTTTLTPLKNITLDISTNDVFKETMWDVIKFCAEQSQSTAYVFNDTFYFGTREVVGDTPEYTFAGLGNTQSDRTITIYGTPSYDQSGSDKLYTKIVDSSSDLVAESTDVILLDTGKTLTLDLGDITTSLEKQEILDSYLDRYGLRRPSLKFKAPFLMMTLFPLEIIAIDSPGSKTEVNSGYYDSNLWDDGCVWDGDGSAASISGSDRFIIESINYNIAKWESDIFCRKLIS